MLYHTFVKTASVRIIALAFFSAYGGYTGKKVNDFPVPRRDFTNANSSWPGIKIDNLFFTVYGS
jgi:hypothetical protein